MKRLLIRDPEDNRHAFKTSLSDEGGKPFELYFQTLEQVFLYLDTLRIDGYIQVLISNNLSLEVEQRILEHIGNLN